MTPQRLKLQEHLEYALLACAATRSRGRRSDEDEDTAAATAREKRRRNVLNNEPKPRTPRATEKEGLWLAALVVRLQF